MKNCHKLKIGLFGIGLDTYWPQFEGLKDRLESYISEVDTKLNAFDAIVVNLGLIDNSEKAFEAGNFTCSNTESGWKINATGS